MDENDMMGFSWSTLFIVTACSSFAFSFILKLLDGNFSPLLIKIGVVTAVLSLISWLIGKLSKPSGKKSSTQHS